MAPITKLKRHFEGLTLGEPGHRERIFQPSSYHATPRVYTPGVAHFLAFCRASSPPWSTISASRQEQRERSYSTCSGRTRRSKFVSRRSARRSRGLSALGSSACAR